MVNNLVHNNPLLFGLGLVILFAGLGATGFYLFGPQLHVKHAMLTFLAALAGLVLASFARPRRPVSTSPR